MKWEKLVMEKAHPLVQLSGNIRFYLQYNCQCLDQGEMSFPPLPLGEIMSDLWQATIMKLLHHNTGLNPPPV